LRLVRHQGVVPRDRLFRRRFQIAAP
jgi:hypothetical protein